ncbi:MULTISPECIES: iron chelate uptake ABC transporter family permease subunit [Providencia]|uniref:Permease component of an ABC superfamily petrobactin transporter n=1 Tax=Providencia heimbachae ATCC 35613 TaxID=1354272 RepID=A0A1B7JWG9_9GAMM|nr:MULTISPECIES: iron chelate uptake ABC transporter family permease subunit [Providencia]MBP6122454.1 iron chelate uptake ABC transporter family permease subunit [Providencia sp.]MDD9340880.1 iron chelate uptake ABC transporter family permease subunit [Providencia heimbachae]NIH24113.1 iron chelate uptake ABC transporter family permease subunit [Providencia heimbachae]OAT52259.1 permease component of an ABC superfamily petrobactin transporter [Providencia heimbachae ATCC 35613]QCJ71507.1 ente
MQKVNTSIAPALAVKKGITPLQRIWILLALSILSVILYMTINLGNNLAYILPHRGYIVLTMIVVAFASGVSTVLFQTIANNKILTPSIMGLEALFVLLQTIFIFYTDSFPASWLLNIGKFLLESSLLVLFSVLLYRWLFVSVKMNINLVLMVGIILGTLFRSVATLLQRLMDPNEFSILQSRMFATFTKGTPELILFTLAITVVVGLLLWRMRYCFDVIGLGQANAVNLGINYRHQVTVILLLISILVAISTALVGPLTFLGLMVANLAYFVSGSSQHRYLLPVSFLLGVIALIGGQLILEYGLNMAGTLSVVIEFVGGIFFIYMVLRRF